MGDLLREFFSSSNFMPHGHCYLWRPAILWMQVISNGSIGIAYVAIAGGLAYLVRRGRYVPFKGMALAFGVFIISCGITHFLDVYVIWDPIYWFDSGVRVVTAVASVGTALMLPPLIPKAVALARGAQAAQERGIELEAAVDDLGRMYEKAKELDELKTQFFANVSHELRTPLALILGPAEKLLAADNLTPEQRRDADLVLRNANTLLKHVNDLLDVSRLEAHRLEAEYTATDASSTVRSVAAHFEGVANERRIDYSVDAPATLPAEIDVEKTERVLLNLLSNAFKFTEGNGRIRISLAAADERLRIAVADSGPGIRPQDRSTVFERFRQVDGGSTRRFGGTGLGLTIAKDFVELQGGSIRIGDAPEGGALFEVELPRLAPAGAAVRREQPVHARAAAGASQALAELRTRVDAVGSGDGPADRPLVLVVEDNPDMNRFVADALAEDYRVARAFDGEEGLRKAAELMPDLVVSDVMMPGLSGDQLVDAIRHRPELDKLPILMLTAKADDELRIRLLREGAQDYLTKPFSERELRARAGNLVTIKRVRDVLEREIESQIGDLEKLAVEVTDRKRELHSALEAMRVARDHAERASQIKTGFLGLVSHELRSPLAALKLQLEQIRVTDGDGGLSEPARGLISRMQASADRLEELIEGLLEHARLQTQAAAGDLEPIDIASIVKTVAEAAQPDADRKSLELALELAPDMPPLASDPRTLRLILQSLVGNAIKFTEQGSVRIVGAYVDGHHRIDVIDTGPGIAAEDQVRIFEPFEQLEQVRRKHSPGVGLGLALVRDLIGGLGGRLEVESAVNLGSRFTVIL